MSDHQAAERTVLARHEALDAAPPGGAAGALAARCAEGMTLSTMHPWGELRGVEAIAGESREPIRAALIPIQRRPHVFFAGRAAEHERPGEWVVEMGHPLGLHEAPLLGIPPTRKMALLSCCEFSRVENRRVAEQALSLDLPMLMAQAGVSPCPAQTKAALVTPAPRTHDGLPHDPQPSGEGRATLALIERMIARLVGRGVRTTLEDLRLDRRPDMLWWGPRGIGAAYTQERHPAQHCGPFGDGLEFVSHDGHETRRVHTAGASATPR